MDSASVGTRVALREIADDFEKLADEVEASASADSDSANRS
jgi:hypothetical protein